MTTPSVIFDKWDVIVIPYPFVEVFETKSRPALVLTRASFNRAHKVCFAAMITTARKLTDIRPDDIEIDDLAAAGLKQRCVVRLSRVSTIDLAANCRKIGVLASGQRSRIEQTMRSAFDW